MGIAVGTRVEVCPTRLDDFSEYAALDGCSGVVELFTHDRKKARIVFAGRCMGKAGPYVPVAALKPVEKA